MKNRAMCACGVLVMSSACWLLSGCMNTESASTTSIGGVVTDEVGVPIKDAIVTATSASKASTTLTAGHASSASATTNDQGRYQVEVPAGQVAVTVAKESFEPVQENVSANGSGERPANFDMKDAKGAPCARMDTDGDGLISKEEWKGPPEDFVKIDTTGDGQLDKAELEAGRKLRGERHPNRGPMDQDGDGKISKTEWLGPAEEFTRIDTSGDGTLDKTELDTAFANRRAPPPRPR